MSEFVNTTTLGPSASEIPGGGYTVMIGVPGQINRWLLPTRPPGQNYTVSEVLNHPVADSASFTIEVQMVEYLMSESMWANRYKEQGSKNRTVAALLSQGHKVYVGGELTTLDSPVQPGECVILMPPL